MDKDQKRPTRELACALCTGDFGRWFRDHAAGRCRPPPGSASHQDSGSPGQDHSHVPGPDRRPGPAHTFQRIFPINFLYFTRRWRKGYSTQQHAASFVLENKSLQPKTLKVQHSPCLSMELQQWENWGKYRLYIYMCIFFPHHHDKKEQKWVERCPGVENPSQTLNMTAGDFLFKDGLRHISEGGSHATAELV